MTPQDQEAVERLTDPTNPVLAVELEPCPFCGGDAEMDTRQGYTNCFNGRPETGIAIYCRDCGVQHMICRGDVPDVEPEHVIELWNRRAHLSQGWKPDREAVARIIDAEAFDIDLEVFATARWGSATEGRVAVAQIMLAERQKAALVKADAILALPTPAPKDEPGEEFLEFKEALSDVRSLRQEHRDLTGGGPGWSTRWEAAWKAVDELFANEDEAAWCRQQEDAHG